MKTTSLKLLFLLDDRKCMHTHRHTQLYHMHTNRGTCMNTSTCMHTPPHTHTEEKPDRLTHLMHQVLIPLLKHLGQHLRREGDHVSPCLHGHLQGTDAVKCAKTSYTQLKHKYMISVPLRYFGFAQSMDSCSAAWCSQMCQYIKGR